MLLNPPHSRRAKVTRSRVSTHIEAENGPDANPYFSSHRPGLGGLPLDKTTPNPPSFVKSSARQKRAKRREPLDFKGFPFDTNGVESAVICSLDRSIART